MAADNYTDIAETMAEQDGGMSEFSYNPQTRRVEVETAEGRELYMSAAEIGMYGDDEFTQEDLQRDAVQEAMDAIQELYMWADGMEYLEEVTGEEVQAITGDELEPGNDEVDGSVTMEDGKTNYAATERAV